MFPGDPGVPVMVQATRATSLLVRLEPEEFSKVLLRMKEPLVVVVEGGVFTTHYHYLTNYKGLPFYTKSERQLQLPAGTEVVDAEEISIPD
jgi:hypothetical protein